MEGGFFEVKQEEFLDKALVREFGILLLRNRELWHRVIEPIPIVMLSELSRY